MGVTAWVGLGFGLFAIWLAVRAVLTGRVTFVIARLLNGFGPTLAADFEREEHPAGFWVTTVLYGVAGLLIAGLCARVLLQ